MGDSKPTELAITLAALPGNYGDLWVRANDVSHRLELLGFKYSAQQVASSLARMASVDAPWIEARTERWGNYHEYRVTSYGRTDLHNRLGLRLGID